MAILDRSQYSELSANDDVEWAARCEYWSNWRPKAPGRRKKYRFREPLILCGQGIRISVHRNTLLIRPGRTHYPQDIEEDRFFPGDPNLPDRIIILDASGGISFDALSWMSDQKIALIQLNWRGQLKFSGNSGFSANPKLVLRQSEIQDTEKAREINRLLLCEKLTASIETLKKVFEKNEASIIAIEKIKGLHAKLANRYARYPHSTILGYEGAAAAIYYYVWHDLPLSWSHLSKRPIPNSWHKVGSRQMVWRKDANCARHPVNAMLNYGYAVLIGALRAEIVAAGLDPSIGIAHHRHTNPIPLVYDLMEPLRPVVDRTILGFSLSNTFTPGDFTISNSGGCRLNPQMARRVASSVAVVPCGAVVRQFQERISVSGR